MRDDGRDVAKHVVKFGDGSYLGYSLKYESRVLLQRDAHRWLTWASAKMIAGGTPFEGRGARAVHLVPKGSVKAGKKREHADIETVRRAIVVARAAGLRVHHVEVGVMLWQMWAAKMAELPLRDDVGYGSRPGGRKAPLLEGVVMVPGVLVGMDQWALVFGSLGDAATDYALTQDHRKLYEDAIARGELT